MTWSVSVSRAHVKKAKSQASGKRGDCGTVSGTCAVMLRFRVLPAWKMDPEAPDLPTFQKKPEISILKNVTCYNV